MALSKPLNIQQMAQQHLQDLEAFDQTFPGQLALIEVNITDANLRNQMRNVRELFAIKMQALTADATNLHREARFVHQAKKNLMAKVERFDRQLTRLASVPLPCISTPLKRNQNYQPSTTVTLSSLSTISVGSPPVKKAATGDFGAKDETQEDYFAADVDDKVLSTLDDSTFSQLSNVDDDQHTRMAAVTSDANKNPADKDQASTATTETSDTSEKPATTNEDEQPLTEGEIMDMLA